MQPVREAVSYRGLFIAGWFGVREKHCSLRAGEQTDGLWIGVLKYPNHVVAANWLSKQADMH